MSGIYDNVTPLTDAEAAALPPLVAEGEDREAVIERIVEGWATSFGKDAPRDHVAEGGLVVEEKAFVDANTGEAIDLGEIVRRVEARLTELHGEDGAAPGTHIILKRCRIDVCDCHGVRVRPRWMALAANFSERMDFRSAKFGDRTMILASHFGNDTFFREVTFGDNACFGRTTFGEKADFNEATFGSGADFREVTFGKAPIFHSTRFGDDSKFEKATFGDRAFFAKACFRGCADFRAARFGESVSFGEATFGGAADFRGAIFGDRANFSHANFDDRATFGSKEQHRGGVYRDWTDYHGPMDLLVAQFSDRATFSGATFVGEADFVGVRFGDLMDFRDASFGDAVDFYQATFEDGADFENATFGDRVDFSFARLSDVDLAHIAAHGIKVCTAEFGRPRGRNPLRRFSVFWRHNYGWHIVRSLGELSILTKVSYLSLLIVPLLAGGWPAVRAAVNHYNEAITESALVYEAAAVELEGALGRVAPSAESTELVEAKRALTAHVQRIQADLGELTLPLRDLPIGFVLAFFAAGFVAAGHLVYQLAAPEALREESERDFIERVTTRFRELRETQRVDFLTRAMEYLRRIAEELPETRNKNLVRRHGETVWVPSEIETLEKAVGTGDVADRSAEREPEESVDVEGEGAPSKRAEVAARVDLEDIVVEEGALAEYELIARQSKGWAAVAGVLYGAGVFFVVWLVLKQVSAIVVAAGADGVLWWLTDLPRRAGWIVRWGVLLCGAVFVVWCIAYYTPWLRRRLSRWLPGGGTRRSGPGRVRRGWDWLVRERD